MKLATTLSCLCIVAGAIAFDAWAQSGGSGQKVCYFPNPGGGQFSVTCTIDPQNDCDEWYPVHPPSQQNTSRACQFASDRYAACMAVCNSSGDVVDGQCVCGCLDSDPPVHENCPANP